jgi:hypothetical protein
MSGPRIALVLVALVAVAVLVRKPRSEPSLEAFAALSEEVATLRQALAREGEERAALQAELARLRAEVEPPAVAVRRPAQGARPTPSPAPTAPAEPLAETPHPETATAPFDPEVLAAAGFARSDVERFRERVGGIELERLYLRDQAAREGWLGSSRFVEEGRRLDESFAALREEFGEDLYDWMLYAEGRPNRVAVTEVLPGSAAESAGLQPGDLIVRYDERRVLSPLELRDATSAGEAGAWVEVELLRDEETVELLLPRGPLGVRLEERKVEPPPAG